MKRKGLEKLTVVVLFILVLILFAYAERDSRKLDRLYKTAQSLQQKSPAHTVQLPPAPTTKASN
jgi:HAMP domain-containing protein